MKKVLRWFARLQLGVIFFVAGFFLKNLFQKNEKLRAQFQNKKMPIQLKIDNNSMSYYLVIDEGRVRYGRGELKERNPLYIQFESAEQCKKLLFSKDARLFMSAIQEKKIIMSGDVSILMDLMSVVKQLTERKQKTHE